MEEQAVIHSTFVIERSYPKPPHRVFSAFADSPQKRRWFLTGGKTDVEEFEMDFRVGGTERVLLRFKEGSPFPGIPLTSETRYLDIVPNRRIVTSSTMTLGDTRISATLITFEFLTTPNGTDLLSTHQGAFFEGADGPEMREQGWHKILDQLDKELANS